MRKSQHFLWNQFYNIKHKGKGGEKNLQNIQTDKN